MSSLSVPNSFSASTTILSASVNSNFSAIVTWANGSIGQDNFDDFTGALVWVISSNVQAATISSSSTDSTVSVTQTGVLASDKAVFSATSNAAQVSAKGLFYGLYSSASSTIPVAWFETAGTGSGVYIKHTGTAAAGKGAIEVESTTAPAILPRMTTTQKNAITSPAEGAEVYDTTRKRKEIYSHSTWQGLGTTLLELSKTSNYTATGAEDLISCSASGGAFTITLPASASHIGKVLFIKKTDSSTNAVTIDGNASEGIDGVLTRKLVAQYETIGLIADGSNWKTLSRSSAGLHQVSLHTLKTSTAKAGSDSTCILRFETELVNKGAAITYADSATLGATFTINETGIYAISFSLGSASNKINSIAISLNSAELATAADAITAASALARAYAAAVAGDVSILSVSWTGRLVITDVIRPHFIGDTANITDSDGRAHFTITKVSD